MLHIEKKTVRELTPDEVAEVGGGTGIITMTTQLCWEAITSSTIPCAATVTTTGGACAGTTTTTTTTSTWCESGTFTGS